MDGMGINNNANRSLFDVSDAHGHAALMLVESLIHTLIDRSVISASEAIDVVETAIDATQEMSDELKSAKLDQSISLLSAISKSLTTIKVEPAG